MTFILSSLKNKVVKHLEKKKYEESNRKIFSDGLKEFKSTGVTPQPAFMSLINMFCFTNGQFNEDIHQKLKSDNPAPKPLDKLTGVIGDLNKTDFNSINDQLNNDGYISFEKKLDAETCRKLFDYSLRTPAKVPGSDAKILYDPSNPVAEIYRFDIVDQINNFEIQKLVMDPTLINVARNYLGCEPIFDFPAMWWSTSFSKQASAEAAQLYHFDMDRIKWLKIFFYLNDVTPENGPHCYIRGSHKIGNKPPSVLQKGYARIEDSELKQYYKNEDFIELNADAGTIFAGDTKCWHKGSPLKKGHRLVLEFEYTSSMFGANYPKLLVKNSSAEFQEFCETNKVYSYNIQFQNQSK